MSVIAALLLTQTVPLAVPGEDYPEIVVVAERLKGVSVMVGKNAEGKWQCGLDRSSGVPRLDEQLCKTVTKCVRKGADSDANVEACVVRKKASLLDRFIREMAGR